MATAAEKPVRRAESRERRRNQLIAATIKCIGKRGLSGTTLAEVARQAGLSQGIVNLHFETKENLLQQTLRYLTSEYQELFERTVANSGPDAAGKLLALMELDLRPKVCDPAKLAVWFAFWGETKAVPTYQKIGADLDRYYDQVVFQLCEEIIDDGDYASISARQVSDVLTSITIGMWLSCLLAPKDWDRHAALDAVTAYLRSVFPQHYK